MKQEFEQQPEESAKAFAAFVEYLNQGPQRSLEAVRVKCGKSARLIQRWSSRWNWTERVLAHATWVAGIEREAIEGRLVGKAVEWEKTHESIRREAWQEAEKTIAMVRTARERWEKSGRTPGFEGMARMLEVAFKLKQFAAGMASEIKEVNTTLTATVDVDWEIAIRKAYAVEAPPTNGPTVVDVEAITPQPSPGAVAPPSPAPAGEGYKEAKP